jgi:hypothetical protein
MQVAYYVRFVVRVDVLRDDTQCPGPEHRSTPKPLLPRLHVPDGRDSYFNTLGIIKQLLKQLEKTLKMLLEAFHDVFEDCKKNIDANFTMYSLW